MIFKQRFSQSCNILPLYFLKAPAGRGEKKKSWCSVAQRADRFGLSSKPSNKAPSCVNKLSFFRTCSVYFSYFLATTVKTNRAGRLQSLRRRFAIYLSINFWLQSKHSKQEAILTWLLAKANGYIMITGIFPVVKIFV